MRAVVIQEHGGPEVLQAGKVADPEVGPLEVLIKVWACGVNHVDLYLRQGIIGASIPLPAVPGREVAGEVMELGELVTDFEIGDRVTVIPRFPCGNCEPCRIGEEGMCLKAASIPGGYAEYTKAPASSLVHLQPEVSYDMAAGVALAYLTAWHMLISRAKVRSGEDVLVHAAGSGVGSGAIQIAKMAGARVIATAGSDSKVERAKQIGADEAINYSKEDFQDAVIGHPAYDLVSLLQDARVDVSEMLEAQLYERYLAVTRQEPGFDADAFRAAYAVLGAQRNTKILGIFTRLWRRDGKDDYLRHLPRVSAYLERDLGHPGLAELKAWYRRFLPAALDSGRLSGAA